MAPVRLQRGNELVELLRPRGQPAVGLSQLTVDERPLGIAELRREALVVSEHLHGLVVPRDRVGPQLLDPGDGPGCSECAKRIVRATDRSLVELEKLGERGRRVRHRMTLCVHSRNEVSSATIELPLRARRREELLVAWDFSTEPEFEEQLAWMREFVREEIWPIEAIEHDIDQAQLDRIYAPLQKQVKERGLWAAHLPPELGGQGFGQVKLGLMHEILGTSFFASNAFGCQAPDSGNSEILAIAGTPEQKERWLHPLLAGELKSAFSMTEPETPGSDPTQLRTRAVRDGDG